MKTLRLALLVLLPIVACYSSSNSFNRRAAKLSCVNMKECQKSFYDGEFDSMGDCQDAMKDVFNDIFAACEDYNASKGRACIHTIYRARNKCTEPDEQEQEQNQEACEGVYTGCLDDRHVEFQSTAWAIENLPRFITQGTLDLETP